MTRPILFAGTGTEVVVQVLLPACGEILRRAADKWPQDVFVWMADSDRRAQNRVRETDLPQGRIAYTHMSIHQLREHLARNPEAFRDAWKEEWRGLLRDAPDNGASALPCLGRLMLKSAQGTVLHQLEEFRRQMSVTDDGPPDIFVVLNPLSGTSRGSVYELPLLLRVVWPSAVIHAVLIYPFGIDRLDRQRRNLFATNFVEALGVIDRYARRQTFEVYVDPQQGWTQHEGTLIDNVIVFDGKYGNQRLKQLEVREFRLRGGVAELMRHVVDFLAGIATHDALSDALLSHISNATLQRSKTDIAGHPAHCHSLHASRVAMEQETFRRALIERGVARVLASFAREPVRPARPEDPTDKLIGRS